MKEVGTPPRGGHPITAGILASLAIVVGCNGGTGVLDTEGDTGDTTGADTGETTEAPYNCDDGDPFTGRFESDWLRVSHAGTCAEHIVDGAVVTFSEGAVEVDGVTLSGSVDVDACSASYAGDDAASRSLEIEQMPNLNNWRGRLTVDLGDGCVDEFITVLLPERTPREFPVGEAVGLDGTLNANSVAWEPRLHIGGNGDGAAVYLESLVEDWNQWDLVGRTYDAATRTFGPSAEVDDNDDPLDGSKVVTAGTPSGTTVVGFLQADPDANNGGFTSVYANVGTPGAGFGSAIPLDHPVDQTGAVGFVLAAAADVGGVPHGVVAFELEGALWLSRYTGSWWAPEPIRAVPESGARLDPYDVEMNADGITGVVFAETGEDLAKLWVARRAVDGTWTEIEIREWAATTPAFDERRVVLAPVADERLLLVAHELRPGLPNQLNAWVLDAAGIVSETEIGLVAGATTDEADDIQVGSTADGAVITWRFESEEGDAGIKQHAYTRFDGTAFTPARIFGRKFHPDDISMATNASGRAILLGGDGDDFSGPDDLGKPVWLASYDPGDDAWTRAEVIDPELWGQQLEVGLDDAGDGLAVVRRVQTGNENLFDLRIEPLPHTAPVVDPVGTLCADTDHDAACDTCDACVDRDGDGRGPGCSPGGDCDDADPTVFDGAPELPGDGVDQDCTAGDPALDDASGIFVAAGSPDTNPGTRAAPVGTLGQATALALAQSMPAVFVAAGTYAESPNTSVSLYGGYEAGGWTRDVQANVTTVDAVTMNGATQALDGFAVVSNVDLGSSGGPQSMLIANVTVGDPAGFQTAVHASAGATAVIARSALASPRWGVYVDTPGASVFVVDSDIRAATGLEVAGDSAVTATNNRFTLEADRALEGTTGAGHQVLVGNVFDVRSSPTFETSGIGCGNGGSLVAVNNTVVIADSPMPRSGISAVLCTASAVNNIVMTGRAPKDSAAVDVFWQDGAAHVWNNLFDPDGTVELFHGARTYYTLYDLNRCDEDACVSAGNNVSADPRFVDAAAGDFSLDAGSPALDAAIDPAAVCVELGPDLDGDARGTSFDLGADERL